MTAVTFDALDETEASRLRVKENTIERGAQQIGGALRDIRDERLYRQTHATFEAYCQERWDIGRHYANRQIQTAEVAALVPNGTNLREAHARELAPLRDDPERMRKVWEQANDATGGKPTASAIRQARDPQTPQGEREETGASGADDPAPTEATSGVNRPEDYPEAPAQVPARPAAPVTGIDGKTYTPPVRKPVAPKPVLDGDAAEYANAEQAALRLARAIAKLLEFEHPNMRAGMRRYWDMASIEVPPAQRADVNPEQMRAAAHALLSLADEWV